MNQHRPTRGRGAASRAVVVMMTVALAACGASHGDGIEGICAHYQRNCAFSQFDRSECEAFFAQVFVDLEARCSNADEVSAAYTATLECVADAKVCPPAPGCEAEGAAYEAAKADGGAGCEPDDD